MSNSSKKKTYNFTDQKTKDEATYKLWCCWRDEYKAKWQGNNATVWYSKNSRPNNGLDWLIEKAKELRIEFKVAYIYGPDRKEIIMKIPGCDLAHLNREKGIHDGN